MRVRLKRKKWDYTLRAWMSVFPYDPFGVQLVWVLWLPFRWEVQVYNPPRWLMRRSGRFMGGV
jgi:hypothetical protein